MTRILKITILLALLLVTIISCEKEVSKSTPIAPQPIGAKLSISSIPEGAEIFMDGKTTGLTTPDSLTWLETKRYKVTLKKELYLDTTFFVDVISDSNKNLIIDYTKNPNMFGTIRCQSTPDNAQIILNGKFTGKYTPAVIDSLLPGNYKLEYRHAGARSDSIISTVKSRSISLALINLIDTTSWVDYNIHTSGIFNFAYTKIVIDENDIIWLGSQFNGITKFDGKNWTKYSTENSGLINNSINEIKLGPNGALWICTNAGLNKFDGTNWQLFNAEQSGIPSNIISDIAFDLDGSPLIATNKGLAYYKNNQWETFTFDLNITTSKENLNYFTSVDIDNSGNWWATRLQNGIAFWNGSKWTHFFTFYNPSFGQDDPDIWYTIVRHSDDKIWFGHDVSTLNGRIVGLSSYSDSLFDKLTYSVFNGTTINSIKIRNGNQKWISSSEGLFRFTDYNNMKKYFKGNTSLVTNNIQDVAFDSKGDAWVVTLSDGIYHFKLSQL